jgi:quinolinate synthase
MAETSKLLNPDKMVLIPDLRGCSLAASITGADVQAARLSRCSVVSVNPGRKASRLCTSSMVRVVGPSAKARDHDPDRYLAKWVQTQTKSDLTWKGVQVMSAGGNARLSRGRPP